MRLLALLTAASLLGSCGETTLFSTGRYSLLPRPTERIVAEPPSYRYGQLALTCDNESRGEGFAEIGNLDQAILALDPLCASDTVVESSYADAKVAHIVFVLDISGSMQENIDSIIGNIMAFSRELGERKWQVQYAAVLFKDQIWKTLSFGTPDTLRSQLLKWPAEGGGIRHPQEAGQLALARAAELLAELVASQPAAASAKNIILYVSDAPGYYKNDRDFTTASLADEIRGKLAEAWEGFRFYYSVGADEPSSGPSAVIQMNGLAGELDVKGRLLSFPLSKDAIMKQFLSEFDAWETSERLQCYVTVAELMASSGESLPLGVTARAKLADSAESAVRELAMNLPAEKPQFELTIHRCCTTVGGLGDACKAETVTRLPLSR